MAEDDKPPVTDGNGGGDDPNAGAKKALEAERAARRKADADAKAAREELAKLKADLESGKTDAERTAQQLAELRQRADEADARALRAVVAQEKGLTPAQAKRLQGSTEDELRADADELLSAFKPTEPADGTDPDPAAGRRTSAARPRENLRPGATPPADNAPAYDSAKLLADVPRG